MHVDHKADAKVLSVHTPWSDWSTGMSVQREMEFFVSGAMTNKKELTVTVFTKCLGQRVKAPFKVVEGGTIGGEAEVKVTNLSSNELETRKVKFHTGAIAVQFDFKKKVITAAGISRATAEMIFLDVDGNLRSRIEYFDKKDNLFNSLKDEADKTAIGELPFTEDVTERIKPNVRPPRVRPLPRRQEPLANGREEMKGARPRGKPRKKKTAGRRKKTAGRKKKPAGRKKKTEEGNAITGMFCRIPPGKKAPIFCLLLEKDLCTLSLRNFFCGQD